MINSYELLLNKFSWLVSRQQLDKLSRNYHINKLTKKELPIKQDLVYLLIDLNLPYIFLTKYFHTTAYFLNKWRKFYGILRSKKHISECTKKLNLHKYGVESTTNLDSVKYKMRKTCLERYSVENATQCFQIKEKIKKTCLEKYGVPNPMKCEEISTKVKDSCMEKYGVPFASQSEVIKQRVRNKFPETLEKMKKTCMQRYGVEYSFQVKEKRQKAEKTNLKKYGSKFYSCSKEYRDGLDDILKKSYETKRRNNSFGKSKQEDYIFTELSKKFKLVFRQYRSEQYPFCSDFHIPDINLYIEYQGFWMHGPEPYVDSNEEHQKLLKLFNSKLRNNKPIYEAAINTWTIRDPLKRKIARENNLNWIEFFTVKEFEEWLSTI